MFRVPQLKQFIMTCSVSCLGPFRFARLASRDSGGLDMLQFGSQSRYRGNERRQRLQWEWWISCELFVIPTLNEENFFILLFFPDSFLDVWKMSLKCISSAVDRSGSGFGVKMKWRISRRHRQRECCNNNNKYCTVEPPLRTAEANASLNTLTKFLYSFISFQ